MVKSQSVKVVVAHNFLKGWWVCRYCSIISLYNLHMLQIICLGSPFIIFKKSVSTLTLTLKARDQLTFDECLLQTSIWFFFNEKFFFQTKSA